MHSTGCAGKIACCIQNETCVLRVIATFVLSYTRMHGLPLKQSETGRPHQVGDQVAGCATGTRCDDADPAAQTHAGGLAIHRGVCDAFGSRESRTFSSVQVRPPLCRRLRCRRRDSATARSGHSKSVGTLILSTTQRPHTGTAANVSKARGHSPDGVGWRQLEHPGDEEPEAWHHRVLQRRAEHDQLRPPQHLRKVLHGTAHPGSRAMASSPSLRWCAWSVCRLPCDVRGRVQISYTVLVTPHQIFTAKPDITKSLLLTDRTLIWAATATTQPPCSSCFPPCRHGNRHAHLELEAGAHGEHREGQAPGDPAPAEPRECRRPRQPRKSPVVPQDISVRRCSPAQPRVRMCCRQSIL